MTSVSVVGKVVTNLVVTSLNHASLDGSGVGGDSRRLLLHLDHVGGSDYGGGVRKCPIPASRSERPRSKASSRAGNLGHVAYSLQRAAQPNAVARRNARERRRVRLVNLGFSTLRQHVPPRQGIKSKKLSKVETLRSAIEYIKQLREMLGERVARDAGEENRCPEDDAKLVDENAIPMREFSPSSIDSFSPFTASSSFSSPMSTTTQEPSSPESPLLLEDEDEENLMSFEDWLI